MDGLVEEDGGLGPFPRARDSRHLGARGVPHARSIPACAGLTTVRATMRARSAVHSRVRGTHLKPCPSSSATPGPFPRARDSQDVEPVDDAGVRSIPACAGLTPSATSARRCGAVHSRVRGTHRCGCTPSTPARGPFPRARASRAGVRVVVTVVRSIPACAGLTSGRRRPWWCRPVHSRVRGPHVSHPRLPRLPGGPFPRARASRGLSRDSGQLARSIPACAGLTCVWCRARGLRSVHSRVRGPHSLAAARARRTSGPFPRARASRGGAAGAAARGRSIPACAGLTRGSQRRRLRGPVHSRVRGPHSNLPGQTRGVTFSRYGEWWAKGPCPWSWCCGRRRVAHTLALSS